MASFLTMVEKLLREARNKAVIDSGQAEALMALARRQESSSGVSRFVKAISIIGSVGLVLGIILIIAANWDSISPALKLASFFVLFLASHLGGLALRWRYGDAYRGTAEALNFLGAGLFLCGIALISQIYNIHDDLAHGVLAWFFATLPLALLLRSAPLCLMTIAAGIAWLHLYFHPDRYFASGFYILLETTIAVALVGAAVPAGLLDKSMAKVCRCAGGIWLGAVLYILGFFRYIEFGSWWNRREDNPLALAWPALAIGLAFSLAVLLRSDAADKAGKYSEALLSASCVCAAFIAYCLLCGIIPPGESIDVYQFGRYHYDAYYTNPFLLTVFFWLLWFAWCVWLIFDGGRKANSVSITLGVYGTALGLITRYFDLVGSLADTGVSFTLGGILLLIIGWGAEKYRRKWTKKNDFQTR